MIKKILIGIGMLILVLGLVYLIAYFASVYISDSNTTAITVVDIKIASSVIVIMTLIKIVYDILKK